MVKKQKKKTSLAKLKKSPCDVGLKSKPTELKVEQPILHKIKTNGKNKARSSTTTIVQKDVKKNGGTKEKKKKKEKHDNSVEEVKLRLQRAPPNPETRTKFVTVLRDLHRYRLFMAKYRDQHKLPTRYGGVGGVTNLEDVKCESGGLTYVCEKIEELPVDITGDF